MQGGKIFGILLFVIGLAWPSVVRGAVIIEQVEPGEPAADDEMIVLLNTGGESVDISKWSLQVRGATAATTQKKNMLVGANIAPGERYVIANKNGRFALQAQMTYSSLSLPEGGGTVAMVASTTLINTFADATVVDKMIYQKDSAEETTGAGSVVSSATDKISRTYDAPRSRVIRLSELWPRPNKGEEFIELYNSSPDAVDVTGWWLRDASGATYVLGSRNEPTIIAPYAWRIWSRDITGLALNDTGEEMVQLLDNLGRVLDKTIYEADAVPGASYSLLFNTWVWSTMTTPNAKNVWRELPTAPVIRADIPRTTPINEKFLVTAIDTTDANNDLAVLWWNFGDGFELAATSTTHAYDLPGKYEITLAAKDAYGLQTKIKQEIIVTLDVANSTTSTASVTGTTLDSPIDSPLGAAATENPTPPIRLAANPKSLPAVSKKFMEVVVQVPPGIVSTRRLVADGKLFEMPTGLPALPATGDRIAVYATPKTSGDLELWSVEKKFSWQKRGTATPLFTTTTGQVLDTINYRWRVGTTEADVVVLARAKAGTTTLLTGDTIEMVGVLLTQSTSTDEQFFVPRSLNDIKIIRGAKTTNNQQNKQSVGTTLGIIGALGGGLLLLNLGVARFMKNRNLK